MKSKEEILKLTGIQINNEKFMNDIWITPNQAITAMEEYHNQFALPSSETLLYIEKKVIDEFLENLKRTAQVMPNAPIRSKLYQAIIQVENLKSKMKLINLKEIKS
ncbi:MAG: hypothetical protein JWQ09_5044 [Segetibacter sp.]|nr:hypothetical protein [Segetibacter sp.]